MSRYAVIHIINTATVPMALYARDPDGFEHMVMILAPRQETGQFTHLKATWELRPVPATGMSTDSPDKLDLDDDGKGGDKVIGG